MTFVNVIRSDTDAAPKKDKNLKKKGGRGGSSSHSRDSMLIES